MFVLLALLAAGFADAAQAPKAVGPQKAGASVAPAPKLIGALPAAQAPAAGAQANVDVLKDAAAMDDPYALSETTAWMLDGSRPRPFESEAPAVAASTGWGRIGERLGGLFKRKPEPRIAAFTKNQDPLRHPMFETSVLFTRQAVQGNPYAHDQAIAEEMGVKGFYSFMHLDDDYIEVRHDTAAQAAETARKLAAVSKVRRVFVSPRVLALVFP